MLLRSMTFNNISRIGADLVSKELVEWELSQVPWHVCQERAEGDVNSD